MGVTGASGCASVFCACCGNSAGSL
jgi:hypothetical protein